MRISGPEQEQLDTLGEQVLALTQNVPGTQNVYRSWAIDTPEAKIVIDQMRASELGLDGITIANAAYQSVVGVVATPFRQEFDQDLDISVRYAQADRDTLNAFLDVNIMSRTGVSYPMREIGHIEEYLAPRIVTREDYQRTLSILGIITDGLCRALLPMCKLVSTRLNFPTVTASPSRASRPILPKPKSV